MATRDKDRIILTQFTGEIEVITGRGDTYDFYIVAGKDRPKLQLTVKDQDGDYVDLTGASGTFSATWLKTGTKKINGAAMALGGTPSQGQINYAWGTTLDEAGVYKGEVTITFSDSSVQTIYEMLNIYVRRAL